MLRPSCQLKGARTHFVTKMEQHGEQSGGLFKPVLAWRELYDTQNFPLILKLLDVGCGTVPASRKECLFPVHWQKPSHRRTHRELFPFALKSQHARFAGLASQQRP